MQSAKTNHTLCTHFSVQLNASYCSSSQNPIAKFVVRTLSAWRTTASVMSLFGGAYLPIRYVLNIGFAGMTRSTLAGVYTLTDSTCWDSTSTVYTRYDERRVFFGDRDFLSANVSFGFIRRHSVVGRSSFTMHQHRMLQAVWICSFNERHINGFWQVIWHE